MSQEIHEQLEEISPSECLDLLHTEQVGRIGVIIHGHPEIFPVNYALDASDAVIFRTAMGAKLPAAVNHHVVFEVDRIDNEWRSGWSVVVHGVAQQTERIADGETALSTWRDDASLLVRISQISITGRRLRSDITTTA